MTPKEQRNHGPIQSTETALRLDPARGWIGGVCAGIAGHFATDPVFVRAAVVLAGFVFPTVVIVGYAAAWILLTD